MRIYHDRKGRQWRVTLDLPTIRRLRDQLGVNLLCVGRGELPFDPRDNELLLLLLWVVIEPQATAQGIDANDFYLGFSDPDPARQARGLEIAFRAFYRELARLVGENRIDDLRRKMTDAYGNGDPAP